MRNRGLSTFTNRLNKMSDLIGDVRGDQIDMAVVNRVLNEFCVTSSNEVYNRWIALMTKVFDYALDESVMLDNPAKRKKRKPVAQKKRARLTLEDFQKIWNIAPKWLQTAMGLALETTHSVQEISAVRYSDFTKFTSPKMQDGFLVYGTLRIHRLKVKKKEASRVEIPVTASLLKLIENSRDDVLSDYIVHRLPEKMSNEVSKFCDSVTQVNRKYLSKKFSEYRDLSGVGAGSTSDCRPTFHEIRALAIYLFDKAGHDPQARAAHTDARSTKVYKEGHDVWVQVPAAEIGLFGE